MSLQTVCYTCKKSGEGLFSCSRCHIVHYCCQNCQRKNWTEHKKVCRPGEKVNSSLRDEVIKWYDLSETRAEIGLEADKAPEAQHMVYSVVDWKEKKVDVIYSTIEQIQEMVNHSIPKEVLNLPDINDKILVMVLVPEANFGIFLWRYRKNHDQKFFEKEFSDWVPSLNPLINRKKHLLITITDWSKRAHEIKEVALKELEHLLPIEDVTEDDIIIGVDVPEKQYASAIRYTKNKE